MRHLACLFILMSSPVFAGGIYTWVDEFGKTNYGDSPPPTATSKAVQVDSAPSNPGPPLPKLDSSTTDASPTKSDPPDAPDPTITPEQAADLCYTARQELKYINNARHRAKVKNPDGTSRHLSTEERVFRRENAKKDIEQFCK